MTAPAGVEFHPLRVAEISPLTEEAVAVTFEVPPELSERYRYLPGQHVTIRAEVGGRDVRRSYSVCANANRGKLRVGIKRLEGGAFSNHAITHLRPGDVVEVAAPVGEFTITPDPRAALHYAAIAAGSGITPVLSLVSTTLESEPDSRWTVVLGNRAASSVMFLDELEGLKDLYPDRLQLIHILSREQPEVPLFGGRIDGEKLRGLFTTLVDPAGVDRWFLCGPFELVMAARLVLEEWGVDPAAVHDELFFAGPPDPSMVPAGEAEGPVELSLTLDGRRTDTRSDHDTAVLDAALRVRRELPFSCKGGMCASCKARLVEGRVAMAKNFALVDDELDRGYILTCQSRPLTGRVVVDYDV